MISATAALNRLIEGNRHFVSDGSSRVIADALRRSELISAQKPFAVILSCSDSRAPAELIFDQGLGELFVIRVAGNIAAPSQIGSVEYAVSELGTRLVVVLGHSGCGAVKATLQEMKQPQNLPKNLRIIVSFIEPYLRTLSNTDLQNEPERLLAEAVRANVRSSVWQLRSGSGMLERFVREGELLIMGAEYSLETGLVDFFDTLD